MKRAYLVLAFMGLISSVLMPSAVSAKPRVVLNTDPYQRSIVIYNDLTDITIYPVIEPPQAANCNSKEFPAGTLLRILVNDGLEGTGIPAGRSVTVKFRKRSPALPRAASTMR